VVGAGGPAGAVLQGSCVLAGPLVGVGDLREVVELPGCLQVAAHGPGGVTSLSQLVEVVGQEVAGVEVDQLAFEC
jgi:hypothetical protein